MAPSPSSRSARLRRRLRRRPGVVIAVLAVIVFVVALVLYAGSDVGGDDPQAGRSGSPGPSAGPSSGPTSGSPSPSPSDTATLPALPGFSNVPGSDSTQLTTLPPGRHRVVVTIRSDETMLGVAYAFKGDSKAQSQSNVKSPVVFVRTLSGQRPYASVVFQAGPTSKSGSCSITIDGNVVDSRSTNRGYGTAGCIG